MTKEEAVLFILKVLKSPMSMMSKTTSDQAFEAAKDHNISAADLLEKYKDIIWKT
jgi:hypothetical protein